MTLSDKFKIVESPGKLYHLLQLHHLDVGSYELSLRDVVNQSQTVHIEVHKGKYWSESSEYIIKKNCLLTSSAQKNSLRFEQIVACRNEESKQDDDTVEVAVDLTNYSKSARLHVVAQQFHASDPHEFRKSLESHNSNDISQSTFPLAKWTNMFDSER